MLCAGMIDVGSECRGTTAPCNDGCSDSGADGQAGGVCVFTGDVVHIQEPEWIAAVCGGGGGVAATEPLRALEDGPVKTELAPGEYDGLKAEALEGVQCSQLQDGVSVCGDGERPAAAGA